MWPRPEPPTQKPIVAHHPCDWNAWLWFQAFTALISESHWPEVTAFHPFSPMSLDSCFQNFILWEDEQIWTGKSNIHHINIINWHVFKLSYACFQKTHRVDVDASHTGSPGWNRDYRVFDRFEYVIHFLSVSLLLFILLDSATKYSFSFD